MLGWELGAQAEGTGEGAARTAPAWSLLLPSMGNCLGWLCLTPGDQVCGGEGCTQGEPASSCLPVSEAVRSVALEPYRPGLKRSWGTWPETSFSKPQSQSVKWPEPPRVALGKMHSEAMILRCDYYCLGGRRGHSFWEEGEPGESEDGGRGGREDGGRGGAIHQLVPTYENSSCEC